MGAFGAILLSIGYRKFGFASFFDSLIKALSESSIQVDSDKERVNIYCA